MDRPGQRVDVVCLRRGSFSLVVGGHVLLPVSLVGIATLLIGFVLQLESLRSGHRQTMQLLSEMDSRMAELRHATTMLKSSHSGAAQSFYAHMADGASPVLMLADLKSQLDLLALQMANENRRAA